MVLKREILGEVAVPQGFKAVYPAETIEAHPALFALFARRRDNRPG
jgi:hypothetical protein